MAGLQRIFHITHPFLAKKIGIYPPVSYNRLFSFHYYWGIFLCLFCTFTIWYTKLKGNIRYLCDKHIYTEKKIIITKQFASFFYISILHFFSHISPPCLSLLNFFTSFYEVHTIFFIQMMMFTNIDWHFIISDVSILDIEPTDITVSLGQTAVFQCEIQKEDTFFGNHHHNIVWLKNDQPLAMDHRMKLMPSGMLEITDVKISDKGHYKCNVTTANEDGGNGSQKQLLSQGASLKLNFDGGKLEWFARR